MASQYTGTLANNLLSTPSATPISQLADQQGLGQTPTSPAAAGAIGANEDQAKMVGTKAQKTAAFGDMGAQREDTLQSQQAYNFGKRTANEADQAAQQKAQQMRQLGSLDSRVQSLIESRLQAPTAPASTAVTAVDPTKLASQLGLDAASAAPVKAAVDKWLTATDPQAKMDALAEAQNALNAAGSTFKLGADTIGQLVNDASSGAAANVTAATGMNKVVKLGDLRPEDFTTMGFTSPKEMADVLGVKEEELLSKSPSEIAQLAREKTLQETAKMQQLAQQLKDPNVPQSMKDSAAEQLMGMGYVGSAQATLQIEDQIMKTQAANEVQVGGKTYTLEQLAGKDGQPGAIHTMMQEWLTNPASNPDFEKNFPGLAAFAKENRDLLMKEIKAKETEAGQFSDIQKSNKEMANIGPGAALDDSVMKALIPGWDKASGSKFDLSGSSLYTFLKNATGAEADTAKKQIADELKKAVSDPALADVVKELNGLSPEQLAKAIDWKNPESFKQMLDWRAAVNKLSTPWQEPTKDDVARVLFGGAGGADLAQSLLNNMDSAGSLLSAVDRDKVKGILDSNPKDGKVDGPAVVKKNLVAAGMTGAGFASYLDGSAGIGAAAKAGQFLTKYPKLNSANVDSALKDLNTLPLANQVGYLEDQYSKLANSPAADRPKIQQAIFNHLTNSSAVSLGLPSSMFSALANGTQLDINTAADQQAVTEALAKIPSMVAQAKANSSVYLYSDVLKKLYDSLTGARNLYKLGSSGPLMPNLPNPTLKQVVSSKPTSSASAGPNQEERNRAILTDAAKLSAIDPTGTLATTVGATAAANKLAKATPSKAVQSAAKTAAKTGSKLKKALKW